MHFEIFYRLYNEGKQNLDCYTHYTLCKLYCIMSNIVYWLYTCYTQYTWFMFNQSELPYLLEYACYTCIMSNIVYWLYNVSIIMHIIHIVIHFSIYTLCMLYCIMSNIVYWLSNVYTQSEMTLYSYMFICGITSYILYIYPILHTYAKNGTFATAHFCV